MSLHHPELIATSVRLCNRLKSIQRSISSS